jgi:hypothetical protein
VIAGKALRKGCWVIRFDAPMLMSHKPPVPSNAIFLDSIAFARSLNHTPVFTSLHSVNIPASRLVNPIGKQVYAFRRAATKDKHILKRRVVSNRIWKRALILRVNHRIVQPETDIHKAQGLPKASSCFAAVYGRIIDNPNNYAAGFNQSPKLLRDAFKVPRMPAVGSKAIVWWRRNHQVYRLARHGSHHLAIVAANYSVGFHRVAFLKLPAINPKHFEQKNNHHSEPCAADQRDKKFAVQLI